MKVHILPSKNDLEPAMVGQEIIIKITIGWLVTRDTKAHKTILINLASNNNSSKRWEYLDCMVLTRDEAGHLNRRKRVKTNLLR